MSHCFDLCKRVGGIKNCSFERVNFPPNHFHCDRNIFQEKKLVDLISDIDQRNFIKFCTLLDYSAGVTQYLKKVLGETT